jgi:hypothetical protein
MNSQSEAAEHNASAVTSPRILIAIPTTGERDLTRIASSVRTLRGRADVRLFLNGLDVHDAEADSLARQTQIRVSYAKITGYSAVRNWILRAASDYDYLIFFDDDQVPVMGWLEAMTHDLTTDRACPPPHVMIGPVVGLSHGPAPFPAEYVRSHAPLLQDDSDEMPNAYSGNTRLDLTFVRSANLTFDPRFDVHGGEDTDFFSRLRLSGGRISFNSAALALELVPSSRRTARGIWKAGTTSATRNAMRSSLHRSIASAILHAVWWTIRAELSLVGAILRPSERHTERAIHGFGMAVGYLTSLRLPHDSQAPGDRVRVLPFLDPDRRVPSLAQRARRPPPRG